MFNSKPNNQQQKNAEMRKQSKKLKNGLKRYETNPALQQVIKTHKESLFSLTIVEILLQVVHDLCWVTDDVVIVD